MWIVNCEFPIFIFSKCLQFVHSIGLNISSWYRIPINEICVDQACEFFSLMFAKWKYKLTILFIIISLVFFYQINFLIIKTDKTAVLPGFCFFQIISSLFLFFHYYIFPARKHCILNRSQLLFHQPINN